MPGSAFELHEVALLGNDTKVSLQLFKEMFKDASQIPVFKNMVSNHPKRFHYRAGNKHRGFFDSAKDVVTGKTPYDAVCADILAGKDLGTFSHVAAFSFLINADHQDIRSADREGLGFFADGLSSHEGAGDTVHCRLLIEEHVIAFTWSPVMTRLFNAMMTAVAAAKLALSVGSAAGTLGANVGSLIDSISDLASALKHVGKLGGAISDTAEKVAAIRDIAVEVLESAQEVSERYADYKGKSSADAFDVSALGLKRESISDLADQSIPAIQDKKSVFLGFGKRNKTDREKRLEIGAKNLQTQRQLQCVFFMTIQQITPVVYVKSRLSPMPEKRLVEFDSELYMAKRSYLRVGETPRDKFSQMATIVKTDAFDKAGVAKKVCLPWFPGNQFRRFKRTTKGIEAMDADPPAGSVHWNYHDTKDWSLADSKRSSMPMSALEIAELDRAERVRVEQELEAARLQEQSQRLIHQGRFAKVLAGIPGKLEEFSARREARIQAARETWLREREEQQKSFHQSLMTEVRTSGRAFAIQERSRLNAEKLAADKRMAERLEREREAKINSLIASIPNKLPSVEKFKASTTIKTGFILNRRSNPKLLRIDAALATVLGMFKDRRTANAWNYRQQVQANLMTLILACEDYLSSKLLSDKAAAGHVSVRLAPVRELKLKVTEIYGGMQ